jgi:predicted nucleic acid-binding protein
MNLSSNEIVFLDANVAMYAAGGEHPYRLPCQKVMAAIAGDALRAAIDTEIVQEILHRYGALQRYAEAVTVASDLLAVVELVYPVTI